VGYRREELRRARSRTRIAENNAPAPPTSASTAVGFSGESVHPVCACTGSAIANNIATPRIADADFLIDFLQKSEFRNQGLLTACEP
jgi:hypothetical protein